ncbi:MAG: restriction endonuclease subunit S [Nitrospirota bacterium]
MTGWQTAALSDVLADAKPGFACGEDPTDGVFQFRMNNITTEGQLDFSKKRRVPRETRSLEIFFVEPGDILFNATNSPELVGKSAFFPGYDEPAVFSNHFLRLRPREDKLDGRYLARWLVLQFQRRVFQSMCRQWVNQATVGRDSLLGLRMPLPPLAEQRQIAKVLDLAEALQAKRRAALTQIDTLIQSVFLDLFGDSEKRAWPVTTIAEVAHPDEGSIRTGPFGSDLLHSEFVDEGVAVLGIDNAVANEFRWNERRFISESKYRELKRYTVKPGDVLITIMGTCGRCAVVPDDVPVAINTKHLCCITLDSEKCLPSFLHAYFLRHPLARRYLEQTAKGAIMAGLNMGIITAMPIRLPPLSLQHDFARRVVAVEKLKTAHCSSLTEIDALFDTLQHRAFRGELALSIPNI